MTGKSKFQISRSIDEKIKRIVGGCDEYDTEFLHVTSAYILGFNYANVTNYLGLTTNFRIHNAGFPVVGLVFFKSVPNNEDIKSSLEPVKEFSISPNGLGSFKSDKNEHLFLIYNIKEGTKDVEKRIFNSLEGEFVQEQPKISVLDESKIFSHSAIFKLSLSLSLNILDDKNLVASKDEIENVLDDTVKSLTNDTRDVEVQLNNSNFSADLSIKDNILTETLYDHLDPPKDIFDMSDYLPQLSKNDKQKLIDKWRNKVKSQRSDLEMVLEHKRLSSKESCSSSSSYCLNIQLYSHLNVNDSINKSLKSILFLLRSNLNLLKRTLVELTGTPLEGDELKSFTIKSTQTPHFVSGFYPIPTIREPDYKLLTRLRRDLHMAYLVPLDQPQFRYSQRIINPSLRNKDEEAGYLCNTHVGTSENSGIKGGLRSVMNGTYTYHHYMQDRANDNGWGCAYRSLQTIISWFKHQGYIYSPDVELRGLKEGEAGDDKTNVLRRKLQQEARVPTHEEIQSVLVDVGDKPASFIGSQKWIGSQEVCYVLSHLYNLESKFISVSSGGELVYKARELGQHFATQSTPVMIGGGVLAHTIIGVDFNEKNGDTSYLILDPHYTGSEDLATITKKGWCGWKKNTFWDKTAFYNLCLPQRPTEI